MMQKLWKKALYKLLRTQGGQKVLARLAVIFILLNYRLNRWQYINQEVINHLVAQEQAAIFCFWHGRMAMLPVNWLWPAPFFMVLSHHADGRLISRVLEYFGIRSLYGSTKRRGEAAAHQALQALKKNAYVGFTPDGPRGPVYQVAAGIIRLAYVSQAPIIPVSYATSRRKLLNSWDHFLVPLPFGKGVFICGNPVLLSGDLAQDQQALTAALNTVMAEADHLVMEK